MLSGCFGRPDSGEIDLSGFTRDAQIMKVEGIVVGAKKGLVNAELMIRKDHSVLNKFGSKLVDHVTYGDPMPTLEFKWGQDNPHYFDKAIAAQLQQLEKDKRDWPAIKRKKVANLKSTIASFNAHIRSLNQTQQIVFSMESQREIESWRSKIDLLQKQLAKLQDPKQDQKAFWNAERWDRMQLLDRADSEYFDHKQAMMDDKYAPVVATVVQDGSNGKFAGIPQGLEGIVVVVHVTMIKQGELKSIVYYHAQGMSKDQLGNAKNLNFSIKPKDINDKYPDWDEDKQEVQRRAAAYWAWLQVKMRQS